MGVLYNNGLLFDEASADPFTGGPNGRPVVQGTVHPECENVRATFQALFDDGWDNRSQLATYMGEDMIVDLWGSNDKNFTADSYTNVFSSGKSVGSILLGMMVDQGNLDFNERITKYWPEFGKNGKEFITVADNMKHEGGLPSYSEKVDFDWLRTENIK